jgi:hypothetical protein
MRIPLRQISTLSGDLAVKTLNSHMRDVHAALAGSVEFGDGTTKENIDIDFVSVPISSAAMTGGVEFSCKHGLRSVPVGFITIGATASGHLYDGTTTDTATLKYFKWSENTLATITVMIF